MGSPSRNTQLSAHNFNESSLSPARTKKPRDERLEALLQIREQTLQDSVARGLETYRRKKEEAAREKEDRFNSLVEELEAGKAELLPRTERTVQHHQQWRRKKAKDTYEAWKSGVFEPIQRAIKVCCFFCCMHTHKHNTDVHFSSHSSCPRLDAI